jgi:mannose-1-phosphate guanylyltransferase/mannose-6-phosphate isomerase
MITVIIAGGSGTRLWPLSTPAYPKHLLKVNGDTRSLLQNTYHRAKEVGSDVYVVPEISHAHHVKEQLPDLPDDAFVVEPARRGTASCVVAALAHLHGKHDPEEPIAFIAADHYVRDVSGFVQSFKIAGEASKRESRIVLVGVEPDYPAIGLGYIQKGELLDKDALVYNVHSFKEKPAYEVAKEYVKSGNYLWNCSYFIGSIKTFEQNMKDHAPGMYANYQALRAIKSPEEYKKTYLGLETDTIDYALIEHVDNLLVMPAAFDWKDLGSYSDLHKATQTDEARNYVVGQAELDDVENSFIHNEEEKPLAVVGLDNVVVVNTKSGILVARKDLSKKIGQISKRINR